MKRYIRSASQRYDKASSELRKNMRASASSKLCRSYIKAATDTSVFDTSTTHMSYYDNFLNEKDLTYMQDAKNLTGEIVMMTPDEYFQGAAKIFGYKYTQKQLEQQRSDRLTPQYAEDMKNGDTFPLCFLDYANGGQEGLHRMLAARKAFGPDVKYPVLVITPYDQELWNQQKLSEEIYDFERFDFKDAVNDIEVELGDWDIAPPEDIAEQAEAFVEKKCKDAGYDVKVECEVNDYQGDPRLDVTLVEYKGHEVKYPQPSSASPWLANMFNLDGKSDDEIDEIIDGLDDPEIADFFFK